MHIDYGILGNVGPDLALILAGGGSKVVVRFHEIQLKPGSFALLCRNCFVVLISSASVTSGGPPFIVERRSSNADFESLALHQPEAHFNKRVSFALVAPPKLWKRSTIFKICIVNA